MNYKAFITTIVATTIISTLNAQSIRAIVVGNSGGQLKNGSITLKYTIGQPYGSNQLAPTYALGSGFWYVVSMGYKSTAKNVYRFTGSGNFSDSKNWENQQTPPSTLPANAEVIIMPAGNGQCVLDIPFRLSAGSRLSVVEGKTFLIKGDLRLE